jgi:hypothetical protein
MEATYSSETSIDFQRTTWHYIPEDRTHSPVCLIISKIKYVSFFYTTFVRNIFTPINIYRVTFEVRAETRVGLNAKRTIFLSDFSQNCNEFTTNIKKFPKAKFSEHLFCDTLSQCCPTFLYIGVHLTDGCGGAGAVWRLQQP